MTLLLLFDTKAPPYDGARAWFSLPPNLRGRVPFTMYSWPGPAGAEFRYTVSSANWLIESDRPFGEFREIMASFGITDYTTDDPGG